MAASTQKAHRLSDIVVEEVSLVDRAANKRQFVVVKEEGDMGTEDAKVEDGKLAEGGEKPQPDEVLVEASKALHAHLDQVEASFLDTAAVAKAVARMAEITALLKDAKIDPAKAREELEALGKALVPAAKMAAKAPVTARAAAKRATELAEKVVAEPVTAESLCVLKVLAAAADVLVERYPAVKDEHGAAGEGPTLAELDAQFLDAVFEALKSREEFKAQQAGAAKTTDGAPAAAEKGDGAVEALRALATEVSKRFAELPRLVETQVAKSLAPVQAEVKALREIPPERVSRPVAKGDGGAAPAAGAVPVELRYPMNYNDPAHLEALAQAGVKA